MSEYIVAGAEPNNTVLKSITKNGYEHEKWLPVCEEIVRCRDCKHATISSLDYVKYCEMFVLPDEDNYGADPQVMLPLDFFCGYGELRGDAE